MTAPEPTGTPNGGDESFTRLAAPVFAGFSVPTIVLLASSTVPNQPWHDLALTLMILASGLFLAAFKLSIWKLHNDTPIPGESFGPGRPSPASRW